MTVPWVSPITRPNTVQSDTFHDARNHTSVTNISSSPEVRSSVTAAGAIPISRPLRIATTRLTVRSRHAVVYEEAGELPELPGGVLRSKSGGMLAQLVVERSELRNFVIIPYSETYVFDEAGQVSLGTQTFVKRVSARGGSGAAVHLDYRMNNGNNKTELVPIIHNQVSRTVPIGVNLGGIGGARLTITTGSPLPGLNQMPGGELAAPPEFFVIYYWYGFPVLGPQMPGFATLRWHNQSNPGTEMFMFIPTTPFLGPVMEVIFENAGFTQFDVIAMEPDDGLGGTLGTLDMIIATANAAGVLEAGESGQL